MILPSQLTHVLVVQRYTAGSQWQFLYHPSAVHLQRVMSVGLASVDTVYHLVLPGSCYHTDGSWADHSQPHSFITDLRRILFAMMVPHACVSSLKTFECRLVESIKYGCPLIDSANVSMISPVSSLSHHIPVKSHTYPFKVSAIARTLRTPLCLIVIAQYTYLSHPQLGL